MTLWPNTTLPAPVTIHPWSQEAIGTLLTSIALTQAGLASHTWQVANSAVFYPFFVATPLVATQMFVWNGAAVSGNIDIGVYTADGVLLVSAGSTAQAATNVLQVFNITDTKLGIGKYYMGLALDNTTGAVFSVTPTSGDQKLLGMAEMASAFALPATATFATTANMVNVPFFGLTTNAVV